MVGGSWLLVVGVSQVGGCIGGGWLIGGWLLVGGITRSNY